MYQVGKKALFGLLALISTGLFALPVFVFAQTQSPPQALLYVTGTKRSIASLRAHITASDIIAPQTYSTTPAGILRGKPKQEVLDIAESVKARVMPLISNQNFSQVGVDTFLKNPNAQDKLITSLIAEAKKRNYIGYQYDFEHIKASDRDLYSAFVAKSAPKFHEANLKLSIAVCPLHSDDPLAYGKGSWQNWTGAYDYKSLGASADFLSVMAYDDSKSMGPVASLPWVEDVINYTLARVPPEKVSIGIPAYAWFWNNDTNKRVRVRGYSAVEKILSSKSYIKEGRSDALGVPYVTYRTGGTKFTAWYEDGKSFEQKLALAKMKGVNGYSFWALGLEAPEVWAKKVEAETSNNNVALVR
jgi:spore germination protein YaaH